MIADFDATEGAIYELTALDELLGFALTGGWIQIDAISDVFNDQVRGDHAGGEVGPARNPVICLALSIQCQPHDTTGTIDIEDILALRTVVLNGGGGGDSPR